MAAKMAAESTGRRLDAALPLSAFASEVDPTYELGETYELDPTHELGHTHGFIQLDPTWERGTSSPPRGRQLSAPGSSSVSYVKGVAAVLCAALFSALAGVYFEYVLKRSSAHGGAPSSSLWVRNIQLCFSTIPVAALGVFLKRDSFGEAGIFGGFDALAWVLVVINAAGGLIVAAVIKYGDNVLKNFSTACAVILGTVLSVVLFDFELSAQFCLGASCVVGSTLLYAYGGAGRAPTVPAAAEPATPPAFPDPDGYKMKRTSLEVGPLEADQQVEIDETAPILPRSEE